MVVQWKQYSFYNLLLHCHWTSQLSGFEGLSLSQRLPGGTTTERWMSSFGVTITVLETRDPRHWWFLQTPNIKKGTAYVYINEHTKYEVHCLIWKLHRASLTPTPLPSPYMGKLLFNEPLLSLPALPLILCIWHWFLCLSNWLFSIFKLLFTILPEVDLRVKKILIKHFQVIKEKQIWKTPIRQNNNK